MNLASLSGQEGSAEAGGYSASKFGVVGYTRSLTEELLAHKIKVSSICPDVVDTEMSAGFPLDTGKMITTIDIVKTVDYILSLSPEAIVDNVVVKCKTLLQASCFRKIECEV